MKINYQTIHENVDKYIEREGKPKLFRGERKSTPLINYHIDGFHNLISRNKIITPNSFRLGDSTINAVKEYAEILDFPFLLHAVQVNRYRENWLKNYFSNKGKGHLMRRVKDWINYNRYFKSEFLFDSEKMMLFWMQAQENGNGVENMTSQPSLRNNYAFFKYFKGRDKLAEELTKRNLDSILISDKKLVSELQRIPKKLRNVNINNYIRSVIKK